MNRKWMTFVLMPLLAVVLWGCPKKPPQTAEPELEVVSEPAAPPAAEMPPPEPEPMEDMTEPVLPEDITELNVVAAERGLLGDVYFDFDQADLRADARERLTRNAQFMRENPDLLFTIEGHCDDRGTNEYNLALGQRRATTALDYLVSLGISHDRFRALSYGEERPVCTEQTEVCWQRNRRAHFVITARR
jgi:peptidoglycan-associated lipoprotein